MTKLIANSLAGIKGDDRKQKQAQFCNQLLEVIGQNDTSFPVESEKIVEDLMYLMQIQDTRKKPLSRPDTPLTNAALFTDTASDLTLESELKKEIQTADRIDILCSFIKRSLEFIIKSDFWNNAFFVFLIQVFSLFLYRLNCTR